MKRTKTIFTGFAPNMTKRDVKTAFGFLFLPLRWLRWREGQAVQRVETWLKDYFGSSHAITFDSGRSALLYALQALGVGDDDEVIVQAYTCVVVINAIRWTGATPVYVDTKDDYTINVEKLEQKITDKTKAIIIQHTFGIPADIQQITSIAKERNIATIEDCAHVMGAEVNGKKLGTFADIGMLSFGSDKPISCVRGGALITNHDQPGETLRKQRDLLPKTSVWKIKQHLLHYPFFWIGKKTYSLGVGKVLLYLGRLLHLINRIIYQPEKKGEKVPFYPTKLPNALATILLDQLKHLDKTNEHRKRISRVYSSKLTTYQLPITGPIYLRYPLQIDHPKRLQAYMKRHNVILGDWYQTPIAPSDIDTEATRYIGGDCPVAERLASRSVNLPTNIWVSVSDAEYIVSLLQQYADQTNH